MHYILLSLIAWFIFYNGWMRFMPSLSFYDEFVTIFSLGFLISNFCLRKIHLYKKHTAIIVNICVLIFIVILSIFSKIINQSPFTNLILFIFNISKIYIIIFAAYFSKINLVKFINDLIFILKFAFYLSLFFIIIDLSIYGLNVFNMSADWTGNIFIGAHQVCSTSLILLLISTIKILMKKKKNISLSLLYLFVAILAGQWSIIIIFIPILLIYLLQLGYLKILQVKWVIISTVLFYLFYNIIEYFYSGLINATTKFILSIPQIDFWYRISFSGILDSSFVLFGVGPGMGGSPVAEKYNTPFFREYFQNILESFTWTGSGVFTQPFSSLNTITSDVGILVYIIITISLIINIRIIYKIIIKNKIHPQMLLLAPFCILIMIGFSTVIMRSILLNSYFAGGEPYAYISCILFGLIYKIDYQRRPSYL